LGIRKELLRIIKPIQLSLTMNLDLKYLMACFCDGNLRELVP
jgi:hypothetical protein